MQILRAIPALLALALALGPAAAAQACDTVPRTTLALYDGNREDEVRNTRIYRFAELVLNHLGQVVVYHDINQNTPPEADPGDVGLVMSWFDEPVAETERLADWLAQDNAFCNGGPRIVAFDNFEFWSNLRPELSARAMNAMGIGTDGVIYAGGVSATVSGKDETLLDYESDFLIRPGDYRGVTPLPDARPLLQMDAQDTRIALAVIGPAGGYVHASAAIDPGTQGRAAWIIDPFGFFEAVLPDDTAPKPDPTTFQGLRTFFVTVSSVGWLDVMPAQVFGEAQQLASEVLAERLIARFDDLPMSVAILAGDLLPELGGPAAERGRQAAMQALAAPNVEGAVQGFSDIRDWTFFAAYDPGREAELLVAPEAAEGQGALVSSAMQTLRDAFADTGASTFSRTPGAPRKYATAPFDLGQEVAGAIDQVNALSGGERPVGLYAWSGNARPFEAALEAAEQTGVSSMGGGGGVMDAARPSLTGLWPLSAQVGRHWQINDALGGDAVYTDYWTSALFGFHGFRETLRRTEEPRRLRPFQLSFAARTMIHFETRRAVETYLELARSSDVVPIRASAHAAAVKGFLSARITAEGPGLWRIRDRGALQTLRLDRARTHALDMAASQGVMGARRKGDSLYIALDPGADTPLVALTDSDSPGGIVLGSAAPALLDSRPVVESWNRNTCGVALELSGFAEGDVTLAAVPGAEYGVAISGVNGDRDRAMVADAAGVLTIRVPAAPGGLRGLSVKGGC
jgi:polysaccharide biosynthesis protein PelA